MDYTRLKCKEQHFIELYLVRYMLSTILLSLLTTDSSTSTSKEYF